MTIKPAMIASPLAATPHRDEVLQFSHPRSPLLAARSEIIPSPKIDTPRYFVTLTPFGTSETQEK
ncbi:hypothetical protein ACIQPT_20725 [Streptomyces sp. NPDC091289]|uniref:hypothetical protein n=1 Tax=Streptomyces sp. NPDC091289 TaxID=3365989 RepID=UPI0038223023